MVCYSFDLEKCTIREAILRWAELQPEAPALESDGKAPLSYRALASLIDDIRNALNASSLGRGDRIGVVHSGGAEMLCAILGVMSGATAIALNPSLKTDPAR